MQKKKRSFIILTDYQNKLTLTMLLNTNLYKHTRIRTDFFSAFQKTMHDGLDLNLIQTDEQDKSKRN